LQKRQEVCWVDAGKQRLECVGIDKRNRRVVYAPLNYPFGLTVHNEEKFFWTDWDDTHTKRIHTVSVYGSGYSTFPASIGGSGKLYGIVAIPQSCPWGDTACKTNNGGCKHLCLPNSRSSRVCVCPDNIDDGDCASVRKPKSTPSTFEDATIAEPQLNIGEADDDTDDTTDAAVRVLDEEDSSK